MLYDLVTQIPTIINITAATANDLNAMDFIPYETGAYYIFDRATLISRGFIISQSSRYPMLP